ncbi:MAG: WG repeat-containing protein [Clostridia bacterium]|nr:WG repeat-containing protein [Clostridia bacterium]
MIEPQWDYAEPFSGNTAIVKCSYKDKDHFSCGLINRDGEEVVPVRYDMIEDKGTVYSVVSVNNHQDGGLSFRYGWYDKASGYFSAPVYPLIDYDPTDTDLIRVEYGTYSSADGSRSVMGAYCHRSNGKSAIPFYFEGEVQESRPFAEGYAFWIMKMGDHMYDPFLLDSSGKRVSFPESIWPAGNASGGVLKIHDRSGKIGLAKPDGTVVLSPVYEWCGEISEGRVFFVQNGKLGVMDSGGNTIVPAAYEPTLLLGCVDYRALQYRNGFATMRSTDGENHSSCALLDREGRIVCSLPVTADESVTFELQDEIAENGLFWVHKIAFLPDGQRVDSSSLYRLTAEGSEALTGFIFENSPAFSEGLSAVYQDALWGYIDEQAGWVIPPQYDIASNFRDGLALVVKDEQMMYIDHEGAVVWAEQEAARVK